MDYIGLYGYSFIVKAIASTQAVHKVKSIGFACYDFVDPLISAIVIQKLVVHVTHSKFYHPIISVICKNCCLKEIKLKIYRLYYRKSEANDYVKMLEELSVCLISNHTEDLEIYFEARKVSPDDHVYY